MDFESEQNNIAAPVSDISNAPLTSSSFNNREIKIAELNRELQKIGTQVYPPELADRPGETMLKFAGAKYTSVWIFFAAATIAAALAIMPSAVAPGAAAILQVIGVVIAGICLVYTAYLGPRFLFSGFYFGVSAYILMVAGVMLQVRKLAGAKLST